MSEPPLAPEEIEAWRGWIGATETRVQRLDLESLRRYAAALGADLDVERALAPLAHWAWFLETAPAQNLGPDGHPRRGRGVLPPVRLARRMFGQAAMRFHAPLVLDAPGEMTLTLADLRHRPGRSGELVIVEVDRRLVQGDRLCVEERQTIVYRAAGGRTAPVAPADPPPAPPQGEPWRPGPVELFRFSAATFNSHRIHYDAPYAQDVEGYPALVVHGPLTAARLFAFARRRAGAPLTAFAFRAQAPLFVGQPIVLAPGPGEGEVQAIRCDGALAMTAEWSADGA